jgi:phosphotransferase system HPr-like phosphotransfer protein
MHLLLIAAWFPDPMEILRFGYYAVAAGIVLLFWKLFKLGPYSSESSIEREFETKWRIGARTAIIIVRLASRFSSDISVSDGEDTINAKSIMGLMMLQSYADRPKTKEELMRNFWSQGLKAGSHIRVTIRGPDAIAAMEVLSKLFSLGARVDHCVDSECPSTAILIGYTTDAINYACSKGHTWEVSRRRKFWFHA